MSRKKVAVQLPAMAKAQSVAERYALELEAQERSTVVTES